MVLQLLANHGMMIAMIAITAMILSAVIAILFARRASDLAFDEKEPEEERQLVSVNLLDGCLVCNECGQLMSPSGEIGKTLVGYSSPPGHDHDDNCRGQTYQCPQGHRRYISIRRRCHACDWVGKEKCWCHNSLKVNEWPKNPYSKWLDEETAKIKKLELLENEIRSELQITQRIPGK